jgi:hypothetical protein
MDTRRLKFADQHACEVRPLPSHCQRIDIGEGTKDGDGLGRIVDNNGEPVHSHDVSRQGMEAVIKRVRALPQQGAGDSFVSGLRDMSSTKNGRYANNHDLKRMQSRLTIERAGAFSVCGTWPIYLLLRYRYSIVQRYARSSTLVLKRHVL